MNTKHTKIRKLNLKILIVILATLPSMSSAQEGLSNLPDEPMRLGSGQMRSIAFSPDGTILAAGHKAGKAVRLWDAQTLEPVGTLDAGEIWSIAFSPDGTLVALAGEDNTIRLWDVAGQNQVARIQSSTNHGLYSVAFSPDGKTIAYYGGSGRVRLWEVQTQKQTGVLLGHQGDLVRSVAFSPDGKLLASGGWLPDTAIRLWDVESQVQVGELVGHLDATYDLAFSPDGSILASAGAWGDKAVYLWDVEAQNQVGVLGGHSAHMGSCAFSPDGKLLASTVFWDNTVHLWDVGSQEQVGVLEGHDVTGTQWGYQAAFSSDGKWLACASRNGVELWDLTASSAVDFNGDGAVDIDDLLRLIESWGLNDPLVDIGPIPWGDGIVDAKDVLVLAEYMVEYASDADDIQ